MAFDRSVWFDKVAPVGSRLPPVVIAEVQSIVEPPMYWSFAPDPANPGIFLVSDVPDDWVFTPDPTNAGIFLVTEEH